MENNEFNNELVEVIENTYLVSSQTENNEPFLYTLPHLPTKKAGGLRRNSGRKRVSAMQRKIAVTVYISQRDIQRNGGLEASKIKVIDLLSEKEPEVLETV